MNIFKESYKIVRDNSDEIYRGFGFKHLSDATKYYVHPDNESYKRKTTLCQPIGEAVVLFTRMLIEISKGDAIGDYYVSDDRKKVYLDIAVPDDYPLEAAGSRVDDTGRKYIRVKGVRWFTNLDYSQRHETLPLQKKYTAEEFPRYDNYDAIEVSKTSDIPYDYDGVMGVPITFMDKYSPEQFEIVWQASGNTRASAPKDVLKEVKYQVHPEDRGGCSVLEGKRTYGRILIRHRRRKAQ